MRARISSLFAFILPVLLGIAFLQTGPARANLVGGDAGQTASEDVTYICQKLGISKFCNKFEIAGYIDPIGDISSIQLELSYDPTKWTFDAAASGPLCALATGGSPCPSVNASLGTKAVPQTVSTPGTPLAGSTLTLTATGGVVSLDYELPSPVDLSTDQNVFLLAFEAVDPVNKNAPITATYFGSPGSYQFNLTSFTCDSGRTPCGGVPAVYGFNVNIGAVPEPSTWAMMLLGFAGLGYAGWRRSARPSAAAI